MDEFTKGPWFTDGPRIYAPGHQLMATAGHRRDPSEEAANLRLMAAAPMLLAQLRNLCELGKGVPLHQYKSALDDADTAIILATRGPC